MTGIITNEEIKFLEQSGINVDDFSDVQLSVLHHIGTTYGKDVMHDVEDCQVESNLMELLGEVIGKKLATKDEVTNFIRNNIRGCNCFYECCETQEAYDTLYNYLNNL